MLEEIKLPSFSFTIKGEMAVTKEESTVVLEHKFESYNWPVEYTDTGKTEIPANLFADEEELQKFTRAVHQAFVGSVLDAMLHEAELQLNDMVHFTLNHMGLDSIDMREQVKAHTRETTARVKRQLGVQATGPQAQWSNRALSRAVAQALRTLRKNEQTYANVTRILKEKYPDKAPETPEALRKMLDRLGINWKSLKTGQVISPETVRISLMRR